MARTQAEPAEPDTEGVASSGGPCRISPRGAEYRTDRYGNIHVPIGKTSFEPEALKKNFWAIVEELQRVRPASAKGRYFRRVGVSSTMGPGIRIYPPRLKRTEDD